MIAAAAAQEAAGPPTMIEGPAEASPSHSKDTPSVATTLQSASGVIEGKAKRGSRALWVAGGAVAGVAVAVAIYFALHRMAARDEAVTAAARAPAHTPLPAPDAATATGSDSGPR